MDAVGALSLSPLRRGLAIDSTVDIFTFYVPHRHVYGDQWITFMKDGVNATPLPTVNTTGYIVHAVFLVIFFFQAEEGIRDHCVTGVQTCALPISPARQRRGANSPPSPVRIRAAPLPRWRPRPPRSHPRPTRAPPARSAASGSRVAPGSGPASTVSARSYAACCGSVPCRNPVFSATTAPSIPRIQP